MMPVIVLSGFFEGGRDLSTLMSLAVCVGG